MLEFIVGIISLGLAIYFGQNAISKRSFKKEFPRIVREAIREEIQPYLNGLPFTKDKNKQNILKELVKNIKNANFELAIEQLQDYKNSYNPQESELCSILDFIGTAQRENSEYRNAENTFNYMESVAKRINNSFALASAYNNLGIINSAIGEYDKALEYYL